MSIKPGDAVITWRYAGPPRVDATVVELGEEHQQPLSGEAEVIKTATVRFADGETATVAADSLLPGGPNYVVGTPDGEKWCDSADEITAAIGAYLESGAEGVSLNRVSVVFMPPGPERIGADQQFSPADFYVAL